MDRGTSVKLACVGLDCHRNFSTATGRDDSMKVLWRQLLDHRDRGQLREALSDLPAGTPVILEGTFGWGWMSDELLRAKLDPHLSSSTKVAGWRKARGMAKSNKREADLLSELWGERSRWWEVWCAPPEVRDLRELLRLRCSLVQMQTQLKNRIHATLHRHGLICEVSDLFGKRGRAWLSAAIVDPAVPLRDLARGILKDQLELLDEVRRRVAVATRQFRAVVRRDPAARRLMTLPGVSTILGYTILAEVGNIQRFASGRSLSRYSLLAPMADDSGEEIPGQTPLGRHVGKVGRLTLKWAWVEAARSAVRKSSRMRLVFDRYTQNGKYNRGRGYIAVAHQLCLIGYAMWTKERDYQETLPPRPGSKESGSKESGSKEHLQQEQCHVEIDKQAKLKNPDDSRPGTGQPQRRLAMRDAAKAPA